MMLRVRLTVCSTIEVCMASVDSDWLFEEEEYGTEMPPPTKTAPTTILITRRVRAMASNFEDAIARELN